MLTEIFLFQKRSLWHQQLLAWQTVLSAPVVKKVRDQSVILIIAAGLCSEHLLSHGVMFKPQSPYPNLGKVALVHSRI